MKRIIIFLALLLMLVPLGSATANPKMPKDTRYMGNGVWVITPHNSSPDDPQRIQAVIDLAQPGDTVMLGPGTFDFSEFENVRIAKNLTLKGAWDRKRLIPRTTIKNGYMPILIGRKTPVYKPPMVEVNGHMVYLINKDVWGKYVLPPDFLPPGTYNIFDDWISVTVNVAQITFVRPYYNAISSSAMNGGTIDKIRVESAWPAQFDNTNDGVGAGGISWYNTAADTIVQNVYRGEYDPTLYTGTDMVRGNLVVQNSFFEGDYRNFEVGEQDEAGDFIFTLYDSSNPVPPGGDYEKYVLQEAAVEWDEHARPIPESIQTYWVKKGYAVASDSEGDQWLHANRGIGNGVYILYSQANLTIQRNTFKNCANAGFFVLNGFKGFPFNALIENNQIIVSPNTGWSTAFWTWGIPVYNPVTGETLMSDPGENIVFRNNTIKSPWQDLNYWDSALRFTNFGKYVVQNNRIDLKSGMAIYLGWPTEGALVTGNTITGTGDYALMTEWANGNQLIRNKLSRFTPTGTGNEDYGVSPAHILLVSDDNTVIGRPGEDWETVLDLGSNNTVIGMIHQVMTLSVESGRLQSIVPQPNQPELRLLH